MRDFILQKHFNLSMFVVGVLFGAVLFWTQFAGAIGVTSISPPLTTGDVNSDKILDGTITNADINASAAIDATKIRGGLPAGSIMFSNGNKLATSSKFSFSTSTDTFINTASTTLGATTTINGVQYVWTTSQGSASSNLQNDGSGGLSWATPSTSYLATTLTTDEALVAGNAVILADGLQTIIVFASPSFPGDTETSYGKATAQTRQAQSTLETASRSVSGLSLILQKTASPVDNSTFSIQGDTAGLPDGTDITSFTFANSTLTTSPVEYNFFFATTTLAASTRYWIVARRSGANDLTNYPMWKFDSTGTYAGGFPANYNGTDWTTSGAHDFGFRFITNSTSGNVVRSSAVSNNRANSFVGFSSGTYATSSTATIYISGVASGLSGLSVGKQHYLSNATSSIGTSAGTVSRKVCISLSATSCLITNIW